MNYINKEHKDIQELYKDSFNFILREAISFDMTLSRERVGFLISGIDYYFSTLLEKPEQARVILPLIKEIVLKINWRLEDEHALLAEIKKGKCVIDNVLTQIEERKLANIFFG